MYTWNYSLFLLSLSLRFALALAFRMFFSIFGDFASFSRVASFKMGKAIVASLLNGAHKTFRSIRANVLVSSSLRLISVNGLCVVLACSCFDVSFVCVILHFTESEERKLVPQLLSLCLWLFQIHRSHLVLLNLARAHSFFKPSPLPPPGEPAAQPKNESNMQLTCVQYVWGKVFNEFLFDAVYALRVR